MNTLRSIHHRKLNRRSFLKLSSGLITTTVLSSSLSACSKSDPNQTTTFFTTDLLEVTNINISLPNIHPSLNDFKIAFISDLHYSPAVPWAWIARIIKIINEHNVDLVLLGGDYIWNPDSSLAKMFLVSRNELLSGYSDQKLISLEYQHLVKGINKIKSKYGIFGVLGNHERWAGIKLLEQAFENCRAKILVNEGIQIKNEDGAVIELFGADDYWTGIPTKPRFSDNPNSLKLFLSHNPDQITEQCKGALPDNTICFSGHTHGGQMVLPLYGALTYNIRTLGYEYGLNRFENSMIFTTRGIGVVEIPHRINCSQELVFITISSNIEPITEAKIDSYPIIS